MKPYRPDDSTSGVLAYDSGPGWISVRFVDGTQHGYSAEIHGLKVIKEMQRLAEAGEGLARYISRNLR